MIEPVLNLLLQIHAHSCAQLVCIYHNTINMSGDVGLYHIHSRWCPHTQPRILHLGHFLSICGAEHNEFQHRVGAVDLLTYHTAEGIGDYIVKLAMPGIQRCEDLLLPAHFSALRGYTCRWMLGAEFAVSKVALDLGTW